MSNLSDYFIARIPVSHQYIIINPGAETGDMTGWTASVGTGMESTTTGLSSHSGTRHFGGGNQANAASYQYIDAIAGDITTELIDDNKVVLQLFYWGGSFQRDDRVRMYLNFYDGSPGTIITDSVNNIQAAHPQGYGSWSANSLFYRMLPNTRTIRMVMQAVRTAGTYNNGHIDDIELNAFVLA